MISILIPVYNYCVFELVNELISQLEKLQIEYEIVIGDDGSDYIFKERNRQLSQLKGVKYFEEESNKGRSSIRNKLAKLSKFEILLFLDSDMSIKNNENFIINYLNNYEPDCVIFGGYSYEKTPPDKNFILRWKYGIKREAKFTKLSNKRKYIHFFTGNFLINKNILLKHSFDESLVNYGYEDTLFAYNLIKNGITIKYIDNPTLHKVRVENKVFIEKSLLALNNLFSIYESLNDRSFNNKIKILKTFCTIRKFKLDKIFFKIYKIFKNLMYCHLVNSNNPSLILFDFYRVVYLCYLENLKKK